MSQSSPRLPKTALITGSAKGIGAAMAVHLAGRGVRVAVQYRSNRELAESVAAACRSAGGAALLLSGDLTREDDAERICREAEEGLDGVDLLINNIGNYIRKDVLEMSVAEWRDQIESNLYTSFFTCRHLVPLMQQRNYGRVVNIGYAGAQHPIYNRRTVQYHIAKTGISIMTRCMAAAVAADGVTVNAIGIGVIENSVSFPKHLPAGHTGSFQDVCNALDFLIAPESSYINGAQIDVSGGWLPEQVLQ